MTDDERTTRPDVASTAHPDPAARPAAHEEIARLADELLPALVAKLGATGLGELEVREGGWRVRLRMAPGPRPTLAASPRRGGRAAASLHGADPKTGVGPGSPVAGTGFPVGPEPEVAPVEAAEPGRPIGGPGPDEGPAARIVATAPAVGFYQPRAGLSPGSRVRAGERLGIVDVLGVAHEILSPDDGLLGAALVEPGEPVEYGQQIVIVERLAAAPVVPAHGAPPAPAEVTR